jgi:hypothetical protein
MTIMTLATRMSRLVSIERSLYGYERRNVGSLPPQNKPRG